MRTSTHPRHLIADEDASTSWSQAVAALRSYREIRGTAEIPWRCRAHGINLGTWAARCRDDYWLGVLSLDHTRELESIDGWTWGPHRHGSWRHAFNALGAHGTRHGSVVLHEQITVDGMDLHTWSTTQRRRYLQGQLPAPSVELLEGLPDWQWDASTARWTQGLTAARLYISRHGSLDTVDRDTGVGDFRLGHWMQRCREDRRAGTLTFEHVAELQSLAGWSWRQPNEQNWSDGLHALQRFLARTGHAAPTQHELDDSFPLGWWVTRRRRDYRDGTLDPQRRAALEALPGWQWDPNEQRWQRGLVALTEYSVLNGHANPSRTQRFNGYPVGDWVRAQRTAHARGRLTINRINRLTALPGWRWGTE